MENTLQEFGVHVADFGDGQDTGGVEEDIVPCPAGCGNGMEVGPHWQKVDGRCGVCNGAGMISLTLCMCGRVRKLDEDGWVEKAQAWGCGRKECREEMEKRAKGLVVEARRVWNWDWEREHGGVRGGGGGWDKNKGVWVADGRENAAPMDYDVSEYCC